MIDYGYIFGLRLKRRAVNGYELIRQLVCDGYAASRTIVHRRQRIEVNSDRGRLRGCGKHDSSSSTHQYSFRSRKHLHAPLFRIVDLTTIGFTERAAVPAHTSVYPLQGSRRTLTFDIHHDIKTKDFNGSVIVFKAISGIRNA